MDAAAAVVSSLWYEACEREGDLPARLAAIAGGFAGGRSLPVQMDFARRLLRLFQPPLYREHLPLTLTHDAHIALTGAVGEEGPGCVVISGTGSICMLRDAEGSNALAGGWGWPLGEPLKPVVKMRLLRTMTAPTDARSHVLRVATTAAMSMK